MFLKVKPYVFHEKNIGFRPEKATSHSPVILVTNKKKAPDTHESEASYMSESTNSQRCIQSSGFNFTVSLRNWKCKIVSPSALVWISPNTSRARTKLPFLTRTVDKLQ